ncbi:MAG: transposase [Candidatus Vogelbacteria bacterium]|nr:transposase [Candidatus Vogelbacteria bacterium]
MSERKVVFSVGEFYHLYNRGNDKRKIFLTNNDYQRFICSLYAANGSELIHLSDLPRWSKQVWEQDRGKTLVDIGAYCLMPNHFHLLIKEKREGGITTFTRKFLTSYSSYFNLKHGRSGKLFESSFKATHVDNNPYLNYLYSYIHLNPVKITNPDGWPTKMIRNIEAAKSFLDHYPYSSYQDYLGHQRQEKVILNPGAFPNYFSSKIDFKSFLDDWMKYGQSSDSD